MPLAQLEHRLCEAIARRETALRDDLAQHVAIPTGHNHTTGLNAYRLLIADRLKRLGAEIELVEGTPRPDWLDLPGAAQAKSAVPPTLIARHRTARSTPRILIAGHLDTVHDPRGSFQELQIAADRRTATGPGVVDMKGGIVIALHALEVLHECGVDLSWTCLFNSDEETGSFHSFDAIVAAAREHEVGLALEPALPDGSLVVERMGAGQFKVEVFGKSAHVGRDFPKGVSAVATLAELIVKLAAMSDPANGIIVNVGPLQGGSATNIVPDYAACWGNVRFANAEAATRLERQLDALAQDHPQMPQMAPMQKPQTPISPTPSVSSAKSADSSSSNLLLPRVVVHHAINRPAKPLIEPVRELAEAARAVAQDLGQTLGFGSTGGVCDGNIMQSAGLPTLDTLGVRGGNLHRPDEFIELASLVERCQLLAVVLARIANGKVI